MQEPSHPRGRLNVKELLRDSKSRSELISGAVKFISTFARSPAPVTLPSANSAEVTTKRPGIVQMCAIPEGKETHALLIVRYDNGTILGHTLISGDWFRISSPPAELFS